MEIFDGAAMEPLGLGLKTKEGGDDVGLPVEATEAEGQTVGVVLARGDDTAGREFLMPEVFGILGALGEAIDEDTGFELIETKHRMLCQGEPLDGGALLRVDGLVGGKGAGDEAGEPVAILDTGHEESVGVEGLFAGVLGRSRFALRGARSGGLARVGSVGSFFPSPLRFALRKKLPTVDRRRKTA